MTPTAEEQRLAEREAFALPSSVQSLAEYHARKEWLSKSGWSYLLDNPARFKAWRDGLLQKKQTAGMRKGTAAHLYVNEYEEFVKTYHVMSDAIVRNAAQGPYKEQLKIADGREILKDKELADVVNIGKALEADARGRTLLSGKTEIEKSYFWTDKRGIKKKCRPDVLLLDHDIVTDIKISHSAEPDDFYKTAFSLGYDLSVALTAEGFEVLTGRPLQGYCFLVIEEAFPHLVECYSAYDKFEGDSYLEIGRQRLKEVEDLYLECQASGEWPGYSTTIQPMKVPGWALRKLKGLK